MNGEGLPLVVSAPSGAGKSTLCGMLLKDFPKLKYSVSCTTRPMRQGEVEGRDYFFMSELEFERMRDAGGFAEWAFVHGNLYGTPLEFVRQRLAAGNDLLFDVDIKGASQIRAALPGARFVFIAPPDMAELERRLRLRGKDSEESISRRLGAARAEIREALWYDAVIINDDLDKAYSELKAFYIASTLAPARNMAALNILLAEGD